MLILLAFRFVRLLFSGHQAIALENAALRMQITAFQRKRERPLLRTLDRVFWVTLRNLWSDWRRPLFYVQAYTVVRWQRERFRRFWTRLSKPQRRGRGWVLASLERIGYGNRHGFLPYQILPSTLRNGTRGRLRNLLIVSEVALSLVLLTAAGLMMRSFFLMRQADLGFQPHRMLTTQINLDKKYKTSEKQALFARE